jgi:radical SAM protein with 4Fe4S-binding SPASM domain
MGGEPFLRRDCFSVARCIKQLGMSVSFVSNGTVIDPYLEEIERIEPRVVGISLDGLKESHEMIRGAGTWEKTVGAIESLRSRGIQTTVITTVSKINFKDLPKIKELILGKGVNWQIQTAVPFGNFKREQMLSKEEFYATALFIAKERVRNKFKDLPVVGAHCYGYYSEVLPGCHWNGCQAGITSIGITSDGNIVGCLSMGNERFFEGNVRERRLIEIWTDPDSFSYNRTPEKMLPGENCRDCVHASKCGGGCDSVSLALTGKFHNNPYCFYSIEKDLGIG